MKAIRLTALAGVALLVPTLGIAASFTTSPNPNSLPEHGLSNFYCEGQSVTITLSPGTVSPPSDPCCNDNGTDVGWTHHRNYFVFNGSTSTNAQQEFTATNGTLSPSLGVEQKYICTESQETKRVDDAVTGSASWTVYKTVEGSDFNIKKPQDYSSRTESSQTRSYPIHLIRYPVMPGEYLPDGDGYCYYEVSGELVVEGPVHFLKDMLAGQSCHKGCTGTFEGSLGSGGSVGISVGGPMSGSATINVPGVPGVSISDPPVLHQRTIVQLWLAAIQDPHPTIQLNAYKKTLNADYVITNDSEISVPHELDGQIPISGYYYDYSLGAQSCCMTNPQ